MEVNGHFLVILHAIDKQNAIWKLRHKRDHRYKPNHFVSLFWW
jgi:hypothetical protein